MRSTKTLFNHHSYFNVYAMPADGSVANFIFRLIETRGVSLNSSLHYSRDSVYSVHFVCGEGLRCFALDLQRTTTFR